jgi:DNA polymerase-3 subunit alpha
MLGLYVSDHPLFGVENVLAAGTDCAVAELMEGERPDGQTVTVGGILSGLQRKVTKQGNSWAMATLEDLGGAIETMFFPATYQVCAPLLAEDAIVIVKGRLDRREDVPKLIASQVSQPDLTAEDARPVVVRIAANRCTPPLVERFKNALATHPGPAEVHLQLRNGARTTVVRLDPKFRVTPSPSLMGELKALLGPSCLG